MADTTITDLPDSPIPLETGSYLPMDVGTVTSKVSLADLFGNPLQIGSETPSAGTFTYLTADNQLSLPALADGLLKNSAGVVTNATEGVDYAPPQSVTIVNSAGTTTVLTNASTYIQTIVGSNTQIIQLPDETTLVPGPAFLIQNNTTQTAVIEDSASTLIYTLPSGGTVQMFTYSAATPTGNWAVNVLPPGNMTNGQVRWGAETLDLIGNSIENAAIGLTTANFGRFTSSVSTVIAASEGALAALGPNTATLTNVGMYADYSSNIGRFTNFSSTPAGFGFYSGAIAENALGFIPQVTMNGVIANEAYCIIPPGPTPVAVTGGTSFPLFATTGAPTGAVTLPVGTYAFESFFVMTGMSTTTNTMSFGINLGTATATTSWVCTAAKAGTLLNPNAAQICSSQVIGASPITSTFPTANGQAYIRGIIRVTAAGTIIPVGATSVSSTITIANNSYFRISPVSTSATIGPVGNWS